MRMPDRNDETEWKKWKIYKLNEMRDDNKGIIHDLNISEKDFNIKMIFYNNSQKTDCVRIFKSEFEKLKGFFFELIDRNFMPLDPDRTVYRIPPSSSYEEEYEKVDGQEDMYYVPLDELRIVDPSSVAISKSSAVTSSDTILKEKIREKTLENVVVSKKVSVSLEDIPYSDMTIRDYMAIHTGKPVSLKLWLNDLIKSSK